MTFFVNLSQHRMLAAGMIDAFVCAFNVHRAHTEQPGRFSHWTIGRVRMMTMLCADYSHGYQTPCCGTRSRVAESFFLSRPKTRCRHSPTVRSTTRLVGLDFDGWVIFVHGCLNTFQWDHHRRLECCCQST